MLLTNDGELARFLELPRNGLTRRYRVRVNGDIDLRRMASLSNGVTISGVRYGPVKIEVERSEGQNHWLSVTIQEGKNREVRNIMTHLGLKVSRLVRVEYGPFSLGRLPRGGRRGGSAARPPSLTEGVLQQERSWMIVRHGSWAGGVGERGEDATLLIPPVRDISPFPPGLTACSPS